MSVANKSPISIIVSISIVTLGVLFGLHIRAKISNLEAEVVVWKDMEAAARGQTIVAMEHADKIEALCLTIVDVNKRYDETLNSLKNWLEVGNVKNKNKP